MMKKKKMQTNSKKKLFFCEFCSFKMILEEENFSKELVEIKTSSIQTNIPKLNEKTGKIEIKPEKNQNKKFKCPRCGRGVAIKELQGAYKKTLKDIEEKSEKQKQEVDKKQRIEDGKPLEKNSDYDFLRTKNEKKN